MKISSLLKSVLAVAVLWGAIGTASAVTCTYQNGIQPAVGSMPLQVQAISVGRDVPVGTEVYRQTFRVAAGQTVGLVCSFAPFIMVSEYLVDTSFSLLNRTTGPYANKVYGTGIPGLGVAFSSSGGVLPRQSARVPTPAGCLPGAICTVNYTTATNFELILIKVGDVAPGVLRGDSLPVASLFGNMGDARMLVFRTGISGSLQIVAQTCSTPNLPVDLGRHMTKEFTGANSATGWRDFSISLNNCPAFLGTVRTTPASWVSQSGNAPTGTGGAGTRDNNSLRYRIDPTRTAINPANGVLGLDPGDPGRLPSATGIGVQVATRAGIPLALASMQSSGLILSSSAGSYSIPLRARFFQTGSKVTPGPASATATFTISYE